MAERICPQCGESFKPCHSKVRFCSRDCAQGSRKKARQPRLPLDLDQRSPLRRAIEEQDYRLVLSEVRARVEVTECDCWLWQGITTKGYGVIRWGSNPTREVAVHRAVLEASYGAPLGTQQAHHVCANRLCVNPEHLQPVTYYDNVAEMRSRQSYVTRITELENALAALDPNHPALHRIPLAS